MTMIDFLGIFWIKTGINHLKVLEYGYFALTTYFLTVFKVDPASERLNFGKI